MNRIAAIMLAAGESRRMGDRNKLMLMIGGEPLIVRSARTLIASRVDTITVVLGHQAEQLQSLLAPLPVETTINPDYRDGQMTSVHRGLEALEGECDGVLVALADQPFIESGDIDRLLDAFAERGEHSIVVPTVNGQRGNPIVLDWRHRQEILSGERNLGCRRLIERRPGDVLAVPMVSEHYIRDLDTPEDLRELVSRGQ